MKNASLKPTSVMERMIVETTVMSHMNMHASLLHLDVLSVNGNVLVFQSVALISHQFVTTLLIAPMDLTKVKVAI